VPAKIVLKGIFSVELKDPSSIVETVSETLANSSVTKAFLKGPDKVVAVPKICNCEGRKTKEGALKLSLEVSLVTDIIEFWFAPA
jgi:hypothetical protein